MRERGGDRPELEMWDDKNPLVTLLQHKWERSGLHEWDNGRVADLASRFKTTIWILCAYAGAFRHDFDEKRMVFRLKLDTNMIRRAWKDNMWPVLLTAEFERLERIADIRDGKDRSLVGQADAISAGITDTKESYG